MYDAPSHQRDMTKNSVLVVDDSRVHFCCRLQYFNFQRVSSTLDGSLESFWCTSCKREPSGTVFSRAASDLDAPAQNPINPHCDEDQYEKVGGWTKPRRVVQEANCYRWGSRLQR